jgi:FkbM family methyltransferase
MNAVLNVRQYQASIALDCHIWKYEYARAQELSARTRELKTSGVNKALRSIKRWIRGNPDHFLSDVSGVIHVGANTGQERVQYNDLGLRVIWVEPIPEIFAELEKNIEAFPNQRAFQALLTDVDGKEYEFHIASNNGASSSILELKQHRDIWPDVNYTTSIVLKSTTLASLVEKENLDIADYQALVLDTQGSELLVLQGSAGLLSAFSYVKTEVPDFEAYEGCCQLQDIDSFMETHGFKEFSRRKFASRVAGGNYFDIVYRRTQ